MLTSKLILIAFTWATAFFVSIALRVTGIVHSESYEINHLLVWFLVFGPSLILLIYFLVKRSLSMSSLM